MTECPSCGEPAAGHSFDGDRARMAPCGCRVPLATAEELADVSGLKAQPGEVVEVRIRMPFGNVAGMTSALGAFLESHDGADLPELWDVVDGLDEVCPTSAVIGLMEADGMRPIYHPAGVEVELRKLDEGDGSVDDGPGDDDPGDDDPDGTKIPVADGGEPPPSTVPPGGPAAEPEGTPLPGQQRCPDCEALCSGSDDFCRGCGAELEAGRDD